MTPSDSLRTSVGSTGHAFSGETCTDLYAERVMTPRLALFSVLTGLAVCTLLLRWHRCRSRRRKVNPFQEKVVFKSFADLGDHTRWKRWLTCFLASTVAWITVFLWCTSSMTTANRNPAQPRPRMVFSFTTTSQGIDKIRPTLDGLVHQIDDFDAIYVVIPRTYQDRPVTIPSWLLAADSTLNRTTFYGLSFATGTSPYHPKVRLVVLDTDLGPASKVLGTLLVEQEPDTIIVYGDDDRVYPPQLRERVQHYTQKYPSDAIAVLGGWISIEDGLYCGRSLAVGVNRVSFVGGAGGVAVKRKFFGMGDATMPAFQVGNLSKACFLGDDYYLSHLLSRNGVRRRLVFDSCWNVESLSESFSHGGLSHAPSTHPGGANVEHYQQCIRELGEHHDLSGDSEFGSSFMFVFSRAWGLFRGLWNLYVGSGFVTC